MECSGWLPQSSSSEEEDMSRVDAAPARARRDLALWTAWSVLVAVTVAATVWTFRVLLNMPGELAQWAYGGLLAIPVAAGVVTSRVV
jgi:hypothetical protein